MTFRAIVSLTGFMLLTACATGNCRQTTQTEGPARAGAASAPVDTKAATPVTATPEAVPTDLRAMKVPPSPSAIKSKSAKRDGQVTIFKYDGSLQCNMGKAISVEAMANELKGSKIKILSSEKKPDGLMHIQVCGQPTGMVNTYTIELAQLADAEKLGFKKWEFEQ